MFMLPLLCKVTCFLQPFSAEKPRTGFCSKLIVQSNAWDCTSDESKSESTASVFLDLCRGNY